VNKEDYIQHGLNEKEAEKLLEGLGREPTITEMGIYSVMWSEHCSYKSSRHWLKNLHTQGKQVIQGPGENAGVVDIGDGLAAVFKMESHNHPSFIEPYQGAATGVGGIMRDIFTMGARPIALLNSLRFGDINHKKTKYLLSGAVSGIGGYGNCVGVPTVAGEVGFDKSYNGNILVNAMCVGIANINKIFYSAASGIDNPVVYVGAKTGRDGIHGATMASGEFDKDSEKNRPTVQVGDPFTEKLLLEACLELMKEDAIIAIQDMGAAGLTSSAVEMASKGSVGIELCLDELPKREENLSAYEMMLSESQERMLMVLKPNKKKLAEEIFLKWGVDFSVIGKITDTKKIKVIYKDKVEANIPICSLADDAPMYVRPIKTRKVDKNLTPQKTNISFKEIILKILNSPNICSKKWVWEQYDRTIMANTIDKPGGNAGIVRIEGTDKALSLSCDVTPRYCHANAYEGAKQAVAECWRNIVSTGAKPIAITNCLNFGNPEKPIIMGDFVSTINGIRDASITLDFPVVSGNVSLYNETDSVAIKPTPTIGGLGIIEDLKNLSTIHTQKDGDIIILIGGNGKHLGRSIFREVIFNAEDGDAPSVNLNNELNNGNLILNLIKNKFVNSVHDISDGGLIVTIAEMIISSNIGAKITFQNNLINSTSDHEKLYEEMFGEDQSRYVITVSSDKVQDTINQCTKYEVSANIIGNVQKNNLEIDGLVTISNNELIDSYESVLPSMMNIK
jgi:phosphoribosylformylglycinamidine synthase II